MNLQIFADEVASIAIPVFGKDKILMFRLLDKCTTEKAKRLALQIEHTLTYDNNSDSQQTKDGPINFSGGLTSSIAISAISTRDDVNDMLRDSVIKDKVLEVWEIDLGAKQGSENEFLALYGQGKLTNWEVPSSVESAAQFSSTFNVNGYLQEGKVTLTDAQFQEVQYAFRDLDKYSETGA